MSITHIPSLPIGRVYEYKTFWNSHVAENVDTTIARSIKQIAISCSALKTFTLHVVPFPANVHLMALAAQSHCGTAQALSALIHRLDLLSIVGLPSDYGTDGVFYPKTLEIEVFHDSEYCEFALLSSIAPWHRWSLGIRVQDVRKPWPHLSVKDDFISHKTDAMAKEEFPLYGWLPETRDMYAKDPRVWRLHRMVEYHIVHDCSQ